MKKLVFTLVSLFALTVNASAMSFEQAQEQALFLTDKMAYELNLTPEQYDAAYEINLDYLMGITTSEDIFNEYWTRRNLDLSYVLLDWQYRTFCDALYFYRPLYWDAGFWHFRIYARYPHRSWFYFDRPTVYISYRGEHCWRHYGDRGYYHGRVFASHGTRNHSHGQIVGGMRDSWNGKGRTFNNSHNNGNRGFKNNVGNHNSGNNNSFGNRSHNNGGNNNGFGSRSNNRSNFGNPSSTRETVTPKRNPSISQNQGTTTNLNRSGNMVSSNRSSSMSSTRSSSINTARSNSISSSTMSTPSRSSSSTMSTPSHSSSSSFGSSTRSMSSHSSSSFGGGSRSGGGGFGGSHGGGGARGGFGGGGHR